MPLPPRLSVVVLTLCALLCATSARNAVEVIGHRGAGCTNFQCVSTVPENSVPAYLEGVRQGAHSVELDVWLTTDNEIVVIHGGPAENFGELEENFVDPYLHAGARLPRVESSSYSKLKSFFVKKPWAVDQPAGDTYSCKELQSCYNEVYKPALHMPTFLDVIYSVCPLGVQIQVELKGNRPDLGPKLVELIDKEGLAACIRGFSSFQWHPAGQQPAYADLLMPLTRNPLGLPVFLLYPHAGETQPPTVEEVRADTDKYSWGSMRAGVHIPFVYSTPALVADLQSHIPGLRIMSWFPGHHNDTREALSELIDAGITEICTNRIPLLCEVIKEKGVPHLGCNSKS